MPREQRTIGRKVPFMAIRVFVSVRISQKMERIIPDGIKPTVGALLLQESGVLESAGVTDYIIKVNGEEADTNTELNEGDHLELIVPSSSKPHPQR